MTVPTDDRLAELEARLEDAEATIDAIRRGEVDAVLTGTSDGVTPHRIYTRESADRPYRVLIEQIQEGAVTLGLDGTILYCNRRLAEMLDIPQERVIGQDLSRFVHAADHRTLALLLEGARTGGARHELTLACADGFDMPISMSLSLLSSDLDAPLFCGVLADLTQQRAHLRELSRAHDRLVAESAQRQVVEEALRQSQKMEAVGQLTGGLAHDFNNLLTGIMGSLQLMQARIAQGRTTELDRYIDAAMSSADRAASLTHRLLAFSRRQTLDPKPVRPDQLVAGMAQLLTQTVGPAIALEIRPAPEIGAILCDPNQLENALLNLAINARDAMPSGGRLVIETGDLDLEPTFAASRDMAPGRYVTLAVTDTGAGMPPDIIARAFDPFFTTKPLGMGTGLGLSMVYGFVKQSGGHVRIHSVPDEGTTVRLFFPRPDALPSDAPAPEAPHAASRARAGETVLVVDDEPIVRMLVLDVLRELGYAALEAEDGPTGLRVLEAAGRIDLLVTDVGLPGGMNGRQLADHARVARPDLRVLFITGFAETVAIGSGTLEPGMEVMTKPFPVELLATRIQSLLRAP